MVKKERNIVFIVSSETSLGVLESQVFSFADYLSNELKIIIKIILVGKEIQLNKKNYSNKIEFHYLNQTIKISDIKNDIVYIRTIDIFLKNYFSLKQRGNKILYDFRALLFAESYNRHKNKPKAFAIFMLEMMVYLMADSVSCVSNNLKLKLHSYFLFKRKVFVFPCLSWNQEPLPANRNQQSNVIEFVYLGGLSEWQMFDEVLKFYKEIHSLQIFPSNLTVITREQSLAKQKLHKHKIEAVIKTVDNKFISNELKRYNFGFLIRENTLLNKVSSPIKFLEYLSSGVIPIMSEGIGDYSQEAKEKKLALVIKNENGISIDELLALHQDADFQHRLQKYLQAYSIESKLKGHPILNR